MNVLYISYDGMTDPLGQSQILPYICGLTPHGYNFTLISCEKKERFLDKRHLIEEICKKNNIIWHPLFYTKTPPVLSTIKDVLAIRKKAVQLHKTYHFSMVHTRIGIPSLVGLYLKKKYQVKFFHDIRGFYADDRVDGGMWNLKNPIYKLVYRFFKKHERDCLENADAITCLTFKAKHIIEKEPLTRSNFPNIQVIPCSVDLGLFDPESIDQSKKAHLKASLQINEDDQVFTYLGSIGGWYLTKDMIDLFNVIKQKVPHAKFLFISPDKHDEIKQMCLEAGIAAENVITVYANRSEIPLLLSLSKFSVFFIKACYSKLAASPTKHGEIMAMGVPVICNSGVGDVDDIVENYTGGIVLKSIDKAGYNEAVNEMLIYKADPARIRDGAIEFYSLPKAIEKYLFVYKETIG